MVGERIQDQIAGTKTRREKRARDAPPVAPAPLGIVDRPRRDENPAELRDGSRVQPAEWTFGLLQRNEIRLAGDWKSGERRPAGDGGRIDLRKNTRPAGRAALGMRDLAGQPRHQRALAHLRGAGLEGVVELGHRWASWRSRQGNIAQTQNQDGLLRMNVKFVPAFESSRKVSDSAA